MSIYQNNPYNKRRKVYQNVDEYVERPANGDRVVLSSNEDARRLPESCRARLISQVINGENIQNEVTSFFNELSQNSKLPHAHTNPISSHKSATLIQRKSVMPVYPSLGLRWNPYVESTAVSQTEARDRFICRCEKCKSVYCPSKISAAPNGPNMFKNNIATYVNQYTMTRTLTDASCGSASSYIPLPCAPEMNDAAVTASDVAVRDTGERICKPLPKCLPVPILRRNKSKAIVYKDCSDDADRCWQHQMQYDRLYEAERDVNNEGVFFEPSHKPMKCFQPRRKKSCGHTSSRTAHTYPPCNKNRKMLYNEGISDDIASGALKAPCSEDESECDPSILNRWDPCCDLVEGIPFSHRKSKYHKDCTNLSTSKHKHCELRPPPELKPFINCPPVIQRNYCKKPSKTPKSPYINLPRKMLCSEKDIEVFIKTGKIGPSMFNHGL